MNRRIELAKQSRERSFQRHQANVKNQFRSRDCLNEVRFSNRSGSHVNCYRYGANNTDEHEDMKFQVFKQLRKWGHDVLTEAIFENGKRADIIDIDEGIIYEVTHTETEKMLEEKIENYPDIFEVRRVKAAQEFKEELLL